MMPEFQASIYKPDMEDAVRRWEAYWNGEIIDRPLLLLTAPRRGEKIPVDTTYRDRVFGDIDEVIDRTLARAEKVYWGGDLIPAWCPTFGPDEMAVFCGAELSFSPDSGDTNWSEPFVEDWEKALPFEMNLQHPLWLRLLALYRRAAERMQGKLLLTTIDLHSNMDLLAGMRGSQRLCMDLADCPELIDAAMDCARKVFPLVWKGVAEAGKMDERGYIQTYYGGKTGGATLQCDFSAMIGPAMFKRWVLPALEEEADIVKRVGYHWDGPSALKHRPALCQTRGLHTLSYVPGDHLAGGPEDRHTYYLPMYQQIQAAGKGVLVWGTPEELKIMHQQLRPEKTIYMATLDSQSEAEALQEWFVKNT